MATCVDIAGSQGFLKVVKEDAFSQYKATGYSRVPFNSNTISFSQNLVESPTIQDGRQPTQKGLGNSEVAGDIVFPLDTIASYHWLEAVFGIANTATVGSKKVHTFTITNSCLPSLAVEKGFTDSGVNYLARGLKANSFAFNLGEEGQVNATVAFMGKASQMITVKGDAKNSALTADALTGESAIVVADGTKFVAKNVIVLSSLVGTLAADVAKGAGSITLSSVAGLSAGDFISVAGTPYMIKSIVGTKVYLTSVIEAASLTGVNVYRQTEQNIVSSVVGNTVNLTNPLAADYDTGTVAYGEDGLTIQAGKYFQNIEAVVSSATETAIVDIEKVSFSFNNNLEGKRTIESKGSYSKVAEGKVSIELTIDMVFTKSNAKMLEEAKNGAFFDLTIVLSNADGDSLELTMPKGSLSVGEPQISGPAAMTASVSYSPFSENGVDAITVKLTNETTY